MKLPRDLSGSELVKLLVRDFGYLKIHQVGSHIILQHPGPPTHRLAIPNHAPLRIGTLNAILRSVATARGVSREDILQPLA